MKKPIIFTVLVFILIYGLSIGLSNWFFNGRTTVFYLYPTEVIESENNLYQILYSDIYSASDDTSRIGQIFSTENNLIQETHYIIEASDAGPSAWINTIIPFRGKRNWTIKKVVSSIQPSAENDFSTEEFISSEIKKPMSLIEYKLIIGLCFIAFIVITYILARKIAYKPIVAGGVYRFNKSRWLEKVNIIISSLFASIAVFSAFWIFEQNHTEWYYIMALVLLAAITIYFLRIALITYLERNTEIVLSKSGFLVNDSDLQTTYGWNIIKNIYYENDDIILNVENTANEVRIELNELNLQHFMKNIKETISDNKEEWKIPI
jgi:hypothetical protein